MASQPTHIIPVALDAGRVTLFMTFHILGIPYVKSVGNIFLLLFLLVLPFFQVVRFNTRKERERFLEFSCPVKKESDPKY